MGPVGVDPSGGFAGADAAGEGGFAGEGKGKVVGFGGEAAREEGSPEERVELAPGYGVYRAAVEEAVSAGGKEARGLAKGLGREAGAGFEGGKRGSVARNLAIGGEEADLRGELAEPGAAVVHEEKVHGDLGVVERFKQPNEAGGYAVEF